MCFDLVTIHSIKLGLRVRSQRANQQKVYTVETLGQAAFEQRFQLNNNHGQWTTVEDYYREHYGFRLK
jgi:hypothetical protein